MLTRDDLSAIKKVIKEEVQGSEKRQVGKDKGLEGRLGKEIKDAKVELRAEAQGLEDRLGGKIKESEGVLREEMKGMEARLDEKISKVQETVEIVQNVVVKHYGELEQRVTNIEEELRNQRN